MLMKPNRPSNVNVSMTDLKDELSRPRCPQCNMRMMTVPNPPPATFECLRCGHIEAQVMESAIEHENVLPIPTFKTWAFRKTGAT
jgi:tRNA(Ile2) C34 agmatinyltransferase TiaS